MHVSALLEETFCAGIGLEQGDDALAHSSIQTVIVEKSGAPGSVEPHGLLEKFQCNLFWPGRHGESISAYR